MTIIPFLCEVGIKGECKLFIMKRKRLVIKGNMSVVYFLLNIRYEGFY